MLVIRSLQQVFLYSLCYQTELLHSLMLSFPKNLIVSHSNSSRMSELGREPMAGFLVSKSYKPEPFTSTDARLAGLVLGFALGFGILTCIKAACATDKAWGRSRRANIYVFMIWGEILVSATFGLLGWLNLDGILGPR